MMHDVSEKRHSPDEVMQGHRVNTKVSTGGEINVDVAWKC